MGSIIWGPEVAGVYDKTYAAMSGPSVLDPVTGLLAETARGGPPLEFAVGTGRVALPLSPRGIAVHGLELSPHMAERLLAKPGARRRPGDMTSTRVPGAPFPARLPGGEHDHERHHAGRSAGGPRQRGRAPGARRMLRGEGDHPEGPPGAPRRGGPGLHPRS